MVYFFASQPVADDTARLRDDRPQLRLRAAGLGAAGLRGHDLQPGQTSSSSPSGRSGCRSTSPPRCTSSSTRWRSPTAGRCVNQASRPTERQAFAFWLKLGMISFGGPAGQIAIMHDQLVERRRWISERRFLHALNFCVALPGPEAQQLASYIG